MSPTAAPVIFMRDERLKPEAAIEPDPVSTSPATKTTQIIAIYGKGVPQQPRAPVGVAAGEHPLRGVAAGQVGGRQAGRGGAVSL